MARCKKASVEVVIRFVQNKWWISHAKSYQNAFGRNVNGFEYREDAVEFAQKNDCTVVFHNFDQLQQHIQL
ncbi:hypothetical protein IMCC1989_1087 [gamma proteobacterium IMCC1989]|nr:hypothetical protein IMCC1989_1087 [gamma proteobacterium IMCC1989]